MDFTRALTFPFDDDEWLKKMGLAALIQFIPIVGTIALLGWSYTISRRVKEGDFEPLPGWENFGDMLGEGFKLFVAALVYELPVLIYVCLASTLWFIPLLSNGGEMSGGQFGGVMAFVLCGACLVTLYGIVAYLVYQAGYIRYLEQPELGTFFQFGDNVALLRAHLGEFGMFILYMLLFGALASVVSSVTLGLGGLVSTPFSMTYTGHLLGQMYGEIRGPLAEPLPDAPAV